MANILTLYKLYLKNFKYLNYMDIVDWIGIQLINRA